MATDQIGSSSRINGKVSKAKAKSKAKALCLERAATSEVAAALIRTKTLTPFNQAVANLEKTKILLDGMLQQAIKKYGSHDEAMADRRYKISYTRSVMVDELMSDDVGNPVATTEKIMNLMTDDDYFADLFEISSGGNIAFVVQTVGLMKEIRATLGDLESVPCVSSCAADHVKAIELLAEVARAGKMAAEQWISNVLARDKALDEERKMEDKERIRRLKESQTADKKLKIAAERALAKEAKAGAKEAAKKSDPDAAAATEDKRRRIGSRVASQIAESDPSILSIKKATYITTVDNVQAFHEAVLAGQSVVFRARKGSVAKVLELNAAPG